MEFCKPSIKKETAIDRPEIVFDLNTVRQEDRRDVSRTSDIASRLAVDKDRRSLVKADVLLGPMSHLAQEKKTWSPLLLGGVLWRALANYQTVREVHRFLDHPIFKEVSSRNPRFGLKYLTHGYLAKSLSVAERASCFLYHYRRLDALLPERLLFEILSGEVILHRFCHPAAEILLTIGLTKHIDCDKEGELVIKLVVDGKPVYMISFTLIPGVFVESHMEEVFLISRIQGVASRYPQIRLATKALCDVGPSAILLAALQGVALAFGVRQLASVGAANQSSYSKRDIVLRLLEPMIDSSRN